MSAREFEQIIPAEPGWRLMEHNMQADEPKLCPLDVVIAWGINPTNQDRDDFMYVMPIALRRGSAPVFGDKQFDDMEETEILEWAPFLVNPMGQVIGRSRLVEWETIQDCALYFANIWRKESGLALLPQPPANTLAPTP